MIEIFLIFIALVGTPLVLSLPFYAYTSYRDWKDKEAQQIINKLRGIHETDWLNGFG